MTKDKALNLNDIIDPMTAFLLFLHKTGNKAAGKYVNYGAYWDPSANGGHGGEFYGWGPKR
jgi:hypothetical protein